jgi:hypothetical protein
MKSMRIDAETLAEKMWYAYTNRAETRQKGEIASRVIPQMCDWSAVIDRLKIVIDESPRRDRPQLG